MALFKIGSMAKTQQNGARMFTKMMFKYQPNECQTNQPKDILDQDNMEVY